MNTENGKIVWSEKDRHEVHTTLLHLEKGVFEAFKHLVPGRKMTQTLNILMEFFIREHKRLDFATDQNGDTIIVILDSLRDLGGAQHVLDEANAMLEKAH